jgi:hypothetical protein
MADEPKGRVEIIMPGEERSAARLWVATGSNEVKFVKLGPLQSLAVAVGALLFLWLGFLFLSGVFLILAPIALVLGAGAYIAGLLGFRRPR